MFFSNWPYLSATQVTRSIMERPFVRLESIKDSLGGGFKYCLFFTSTWGDDPIWRAYFSNGLKPPTSSSYFITWWLLQDPTSTRPTTRERLEQSMSFEGMTCHTMSWQQFCGPVSLKSAQGRILAEAGRSPQRTSTGGLIWSGIIKWPIWGRSNKYTMQIYGNFWRISPVSSGVKKKN